MLDAICLETPPVMAVAITDTWEDEADKKFYEVALAANAVLVTGNTKHFPRNKRIVTPAEFLTLFGM